MMKTNAMILLMVLLLFSGTVTARNEKDIDTDVLKDLHGRLNLSPEALALQAALQNGQPGEFFLNRDVLKNHNT